MFERGGLYSAESLDDVARCVGQAVALSGELVFVLESVEWPGCFHLVSEHDEAQLHVWTPVPASTDRCGGI